MAKQEYVCLSCGNYYSTVQAASFGKNDKVCPKCSSSNVMRLNVSKLFGLTGGGG